MGNIVCHIHGIITEIPLLILKIRGLLEKYPTVFFLCEHLMDYNLARLHDPTLNLSAHA